MYVTGNINNWAFFIKPGQFKNYPNITLHMSKAYGPFQNRLGLGCDIIKGSRKIIPVFIMTAQCNILS